jgi:hypothetical protein
MQDNTEVWAVMRERFGTLLCVVLLLALHVSAQSKEPTLEDTMTSIANSLNTRGIVSWTTTLDGLFGAQYKTSNSLAEVNADPSTCSLGWANIEMEPPDKTVETYLLQLKTVSVVEVHPYSRTWESESDKRFEPRFSPDTYLVQIKTTSAMSGHRETYKKDQLKSKASLPNNHEANIQFADKETATRAADAVRHAGDLCGATFTQ